MTGPGARVDWWISKPYSRGTRHFNFVPLVSFVGYAELLIDPMFFQRCSNKAVSDELTDQVIETPNSLLIAFYNPYRLFYRG